MINPKTISEQMLFSTVRIECKNDSVGTGFFFNFTCGDKVVPTIITNKHVVNGNQKENINFFLHTGSNSKPDGGTLNIKYITDWYFHPNMDLCFCFVGKLFKQIKEQTKKNIFYIPVRENLVLEEVKLQELSAIEEVVMVGYPNGLWDKANNLPLFRKGITATHPAIDFNNKNIGAVDMACFKGSSGSPIFILNENGYTDKNGTSHIGARRLLFLGVLFSGPECRTRGELVVEEVNMQQKISPIVPQFINLGYYIKATEILSLKSIVEDILRKEL